MSDGRVKTYAEGLRMAREQRRGIRFTEGYASAIDPASVYLAREAQALVDKGKFATYAEALEFVFDSGGLSDAQQMAIIGNAIRNNDLIAEMLRKAVRSNVKTRRAAAGTPIGEADTNAMTDDQIKYIADMLGMTPEALSGQ